jgi:mono/diheme cytochrome c family protein
MRALSAIAIAALVAGFIVLGTSAFEPAAPRATTPSDIPEEARNRPNPRRATSDSVDTGRRIFSKDCATCHGATGDGKGAMVGGGLPDFRSPTVQDRRTDGELFYILTEGHGRMLGDGDRLPESQRWDTVNFIRSLRREG